MKSREEYLESIHKLGRVTNLIALLLMIGVPFASMFITNVYPDFKELITILIPVAAVWIVVGIAEFIAYVPMLGPSGSYLSFVTGNISNMKLPASISAQNSLGAAKGSEESEVASTIAIASTSIVTVIILIIGLIALPFLTPFLENPILKPGFDNIMPGLMGALAAPYIIASPKKTIIPLISLLIIYYVIFPLVGPNISALISAFLTVIIIVISVSSSYILWKRSCKKK
ncbi:hypothetical protein [Mycoplasma sp. P36-A1]|uniref:hypothetical protein n=1 Tax=Mycoplasma sp. P36-A1 TaxID=3252900 RepID=UPI003C2FBEBC